jgi:hypothetical protein
MPSGTPRPSASRSSLSGPPDERLARCLVSGILGRIRFLSSRGFGFIVELEDSGQPTGREWFFHARVLVTPGELPRQVAWVDLMDRAMRRGEFGESESVDLSDGPLVKFLPTEVIQPKGPAAAVVVVLEGEQLERAVERVAGMAKQKENR